MLSLPRLLGEGCVLQCGKPVRIYGAAAPKAGVTVRVQGQCAQTSADAAGQWCVWLAALTPGGPFELQVADDAGHTLRRSVYIGQVWVCAGQSNMELPMARVQDRYPQEMTAPQNPWLRTFKITEHYRFDAPLREHQSGEWKPANEQTIADFSASAYFFGKALGAALGVPVGLIDASKGGSRIEAWLDAAQLADYPQLLQEAEPLKPQGATAAFDARQQAADAAWHAALAQQEQQNAAGQGEGWQPITLPGYLAQAGLPDFCGSVLLRRRFTAPAALVAANRTAPVRLWLGTMVDSDQTSVNGVAVGETGYQYPPRKYTVPAGLLREGENANEITIRLVCGDGHGRLTPGKDYCIFAADGARAELAGVWQYRVLARTTPVPRMDFLCRKATGLYNGMVAPCHPYTVSGVFWYQGESNDFRPGDYAALLKTLITSWRGAWGEQLPFIVAQLPDFAIDLHPTNSGWPQIRAAQSAAAALPGVAVTVNLDLGEDNDLHPLNKKGVGERAAQAALALVYGGEMLGHGPVPTTAVRQGGVVCVRFAAAEALQTGDGQAPAEFELAGADGVFHPATAALCQKEVRLQCAAVPVPQRLRYAWSNAPRRGLLCDASGLLASPFAMDVTATAET